MAQVIISRTFRNWLDGLKDRSAYRRITARILRLEVDNFGDSKSIGDGVSELRLDVGPGYRLYYTRRGMEIVILLCGGDKSTQSADIRKAKAMSKELPR